IPFEQVVEALSPTRSLARHPLFQTSIGWTEGNETATIELAGVDTSQALDGLGVAKFDMAIGAGPDDNGGLRVSVEYAADLFDQETADNIGRRLLRVLEQVTADPRTRPSDLRLLDAEETRALLDQGQGPHPASEPTTLLRLLAERTAQHPDRTALRWDQDTLTYGELDTRAHHLALHLIEHGITPGMDVPVLMQRSHHTVVAFLAILKTGAAYQPLHTDLPEHRLRQLLAPNPCNLVITDTALAHHPGLSNHHTLTCDRTLPETDSTQHPLAGGTDAEPPVPLVHTQLGNSSSQHPLPVVRPLDIAYTMHTSGTTGTPKAIAITHQGVVDLATDPAWNLQPHHRVLFHAPHAFDASTYEIWAPLLHGAQLVIAPPETIDTTALAHLIPTHHITHLSLTAGMFRVVVEEDAHSLTGLTEITTGGDTISPTAVNHLLTTHPDMIVRTTYGPTETTLCATQQPWTHTHRPNGQAPQSNNADTQAPVQAPDGPVPPGVTTAPVQAPDGHLLQGETAHPAQAPVPSPAGPIPLGKAMHHTGLLLLDPYLQPVPPGVQGELYITGTGLARGYTHQPALTATHFTPNPHSTTPGTRMYRTGDLAHWTPPGVLIFH
ncbi:AMP-binding protein, partial [Bacillus mobilis]